MRPLTPAQWVYLGRALQWALSCIILPLLFLLVVMYLALIVRLAVWGWRLVWLG